MEDPDWGWDTGAWDTGMTMAACPAIKGKAALKYVATNEIVRYWMRKQSMGFCQTSVQRVYETTGIAVIVMLYLLDTSLNVYLISEVVSDQSYTIHTNP